MTRLIALLFLLFAGLSGASAQGGKLPADLVKASLVAEPGAIRAGEPFTVGIRMVMRPHWHVYWRNPGDSGLPPDMAWSLPQGFSAGAIAWPVPSRIPVSHLVNFGYENEVILLATVTPPAELASGRSVTLSGKLTYLVCERECVPGSADLRLAVPAAPEGSSAAPNPNNRALFAKAREALPVPSPWPSRLTRDGERLVVNLDAPGLTGEAIRNAAFFPYAETAIEHAAPQDLAVDGQGLRLTLTRSAIESEAPTSLPGVLTFDEAAPGGTLRRAFALGEAPAQAVPAAAAIETAPAAVPAARPAEPDLTLWSAAGLAFLGGIILNLMPCVFPVLSIKVLSLVQHSGEPPERVRLHGLAYTAGVLAMFLGLAALLIALKGAGSAIGWGYQLQSPLVVAGLAYLLFAMGLSLSGVFHLGAGVAGIGDGLTRRGGLQGSFFTGILATVVATPCTAPFMGSAVGFALTQPAGVALIVFASLGLGLALPFLVLTTWPAAVRRLPRPGAWMDVLKGAFAFPLYATTAWLIWVLAQQVGPTGLLSALAGLVLVGFAAWAWEKARDAAPAGRAVGRGAAAAAMLALVALTAGLDRDRAEPVSMAAGQEAFTQARLDALVSQGRPVFVNMTAAWCITCQVNERTALRTAAVQEAFKARGITSLKGDWTNQNPEITRLLERHGRNGVPLYLLYGTGGEPVVLPQILTQSAILAALEPIAVADRRAASLDSGQR